jgi:hypothetical protein
MPKRHGTNPRAKKYKKQLDDARKHEEAEKAKIERKHASEIKRLEKQVEEIKELGRQKLGPFSQRMIKLVMDSHEGRRGKKISRPEAMLRLLAIDEWHKIKMIEEFEKRRMAQSKLFKYDEESLHFLDAETRTNALAIIIGKKPTIATQKETMQRRNRLVKEVEKAFKGENSRFD